MSNTPDPIVEANEERFAKRFTAWTIIGLFSVIVALVLGISSYPDLREETGLRAAIASWRIDEVTARTWMCIAGLLATTTLLVRALLTIGAPAPPAWGRRLFVVAMCAALLLAGFTHFYANRGVVNRHTIKVWDLYHYYLGPKYFDELMHNGLYDATVIAANESGYSLRPNDTIRDLDTYRLKPVSEVPDDSPHVQSFSPERWQSFKDDIVFMRWYAGSNMFGAMLRDHGYNGTPVWNFFGSTLSNRIPVSYQHLTAVTLIDVLLLATAFLAVVICFGWRACLLFAVLYCINAANRFDSVGGSFLRYTWMAALVFAVCSLKTRRYALAGAFTALAAGLNVFPIVFAGGVAIRGMAAAVRMRGIPSEYLRYAIAFMITGGVLFALSLTVGHGLDNWRSFFAQMDQHSEKLTSSRVGFVYNFVYHGEITPESPQVSYGQKELELQAMQPWLNGLILFLLALVAIVCTRLDDTRATIFFGVAGLFLLFSMVQYYWALLALLVLLWPPEPRKWGDALGQMLPFAIMTTAYTALVLTGYLKFVNNTVMSALLTAYLAFVLVYFAWQNGFLPRFKRWGRKRVEEEYASL